MTLRALHELQGIMFRTYVRNMMLFAALPYHLAGGAAPRMILHAWNRVDRAPPIDAMIRDCSDDFPSPGGGGQPLPRGKGAHPYRQPVSQPRPAMSGMLQEAPQRGAADEPMATDTPT